MRGQHPRALLHARSRRAPPPSPPRRPAPPPKPLLLAAQWGRCGFWVLPTPHLLLHQARGSVTQQARHTLTRRFARALPAMPRALRPRAHSPSPPAQHSDHTLRPLLPLFRACSPRVGRVGRLRMTGGGHEEELGGKRKRSPASDDGEGGVPAALEHDPKRPRRLEGKRADHVAASEAQSEAQGGEACGALPGETQEGGGASPRRGG